MAENQQGNDNLQQTCINKKLENKNHYAETKLGDWSMDISIDYPKKERKMYQCL